MSWCGSLQVVVSLLIAALSLAEAPPEVPSLTSFCEVVLHPAKFFNREVVVEAEYVTDGIERSLLINRSCKGRMGIGLGDDLQEDVWNFMPAIDPLFPKEVRVFGYFVGKITREQPNNMQFYKDDGYRFSVRRVTNVKIKPPLR